MTKQAKQAAESAADDALGLEKFRAALSTGSVEDLFIDGKIIDAVLDDIDRIARQTPADLTTAKGRKSIASTAHKVARSKVYLDDIGKVLVADWKAKAAMVDATRRKIRERLDGLKADIRRPLDDWEAAEEQRLERCKAEEQRIRELIKSMSTAESLDELDKVLESIRGSFLHDDEDFGEKAARWATIASDYYPGEAARIRAAAERAAAEAAAAAERARINAEVEAQRAELVKMRAEMDAEREELARMRRELMEQRAKIEVSKENPPEPVQAQADGLVRFVPVDDTDPPADPLFDSGEPVTFTAGNREEPPAEEWDDSDTFQDEVLGPLVEHVANPPGSAVVADPMAITSRDSIVLRDPETGTPEVDHVGLAIDVLKDELRTLADTAHDAYTAVLRLCKCGGEPVEYMPYLVRLNDAVYRAYDLIGYKPAEIKAGTLAKSGKGGAK